MAAIHDQVEFSTIDFDICNIVVESWVLKLHLLRHIKSKIRLQLYVHIFEIAATHFFYFVIAGALAKKQYGFYEKSLDYQIINPLDY